MEEGYALQNLLEKTLNLFHGETSIVEFLNYLVKRHSQGLENHAVVLLIVKMLDKSHNAFFVIRVFLIQVLDDLTLDLKFIKY